MEIRDEHKNRVTQAIESLLAFALRAHLIEKMDQTLIRNALLDLFQLNQPAVSQEDASDEFTSTSIGSIRYASDSPLVALDALIDYGFESRLFPENTVTYRDLWDARIMGILTPRPSEVVHQFWLLAKSQSIQHATDYLYQLSIDTNYIRMDRIQKNSYWQTVTPYGEIELTINLSKPEKDPNEIAMLKSMPQSTYPRCALCIENVGYAGRFDHPARQNLRVIPIRLDSEDWYFQYSPYVYYQEHSIVFSHEHVPMHISRHTFDKIFDFIDVFPHYFIGSNADLPIVGGSILNHDHFQSGRHSFPMERATTERTFRHPQFTQVNASIVKWPMSVIRLSSHDRYAIVELASLILDQWKAYQDVVIDLIAYTASDRKDPDAQAIPHNTITPIGRNNRREEYELDLVLRNNRTSDEHPDGIFHPHQHLHHIKRENIGLIEVMGLAVLPGRLQVEIMDIHSYLTGNKLFNRNELIAIPSHPLHKHLNWIEQLLDQYGHSVPSEQAHEILRVEIGHKFMEVLQDAGVFKRNLQGQSAFLRFMTHVGFQEQ